MADTIERAESDRSVRAVVFLGAGGNFTSGNDVSDFPEKPLDNGATPVFRFVKSLVESSVPMVAGVEGVAVGIGATMLLHLDSVVAGPESTILMPFINLAVVPEAGASLLLPRMLGYARAAEFLMRGKPLDGRRALEMGIVSTLAESGQVEATALRIAADFARKPPDAMRKTKRLLKGDTQALLDRIRLEEEQLFECFASAEAREALTAFREKRPPDFSTD
jgi:enoyl-CoA hydratase/carnithine racemase